MPGKMDPREVNVGGEMGCRESSWEATAPVQVRNNEGLQSGKRTSRARHN